MKDEDILKRAIEKAKDKGYKEEPLDKQWAINVAIMPIIFSHSWAKAFWGKEKCDVCCTPPQANWKFQLQQMVLEEEPLKYLEKFL